MMHPRLRLTMILGLVVAVAAMAATAALGTTVKRFDSIVTLAKRNPFHGHVSSQKHACEVGRTVKVLQAKNDGLFDKTKTDGDGKWSIPATPNGNFYAKVTRRKEGTAGTTFVCRPDTSPTRHFGSGGY